MFYSELFRRHLVEYLKCSSSRKLSTETDGAVSRTTINRLADATTGNIKVSTWLILCTAIGKSPHDYLDMELQ